MRLYFWLGVGEARDCGKVRSATINTLESIIANQRELERWL